MWFTCLRFSVVAVACPSLVLGAHGLHVLGMAEVFLPLVFASVLGSAACFTVPGGQKYRKLGYFLFSVNCVMAISSVSASFLQSYDNALIANEHAAKTRGTEEANQARIKKLEGKLDDLTLSAANRQVITLQNDQHWLLTNRCDANTRKTVVQVRYCNRVQAALETQNDAIELDNRQNGRYYRGTTDIEMLDGPHRRSASPVSEALMALGRRIANPLSEPADKEILLLLAVVLGITAEVVATFLPKPILQHISAAEEKYRNRIIRQEPVPAPVAHQQDHPRITEKSLVDNQSVGLPAIPIAPSATAFIERSFTACIGGNMLARPVYSAYCKWCKRNGLKASTEAEFGEAMDLTGYTKRLVKKRQHYLGVRVKEAKLEVVR